MENKKGKEELRPILSLFILLSSFSFISYLPLFFLSLFIHFGRIIAPISNSCLSFLLSVILSLA